MRLKKSGRPVTRSRTVVPELETGLETNLFLYWVLDWYVASFMGQAIDQVTVLGTIK